MENFSTFASMSDLSATQKLERIAEGWKNVVFLSPTVEVLAKGRAEICSKCPEAVESSFLQAVGKVLSKVESIKCGICNCPISAKTRVVDEKCPHPDGPKW